MFRVSFANHPGRQQIRVIDRFACFVQRVAPGFCRAYRFQSRRHVPRLAGMATLEFDENSLGAMPTE
jgi:hypothetical protein